MTLKIWRAHLVLVGLDAGDVGARRVAHLDHRPPHLAAVVDGDLAARQRVLEEGVDHQVEAHARRPAVDGALAQHDRAEVLVGERQQALLALVLGARVGGARRDFGILVEDQVGVGILDPLVVDRAGRGEDVALHAGLLGLLGGDLGGDGVHLVVRVGIELGRRVVGQAAEVDHRRDVVEHRLVHGAHVAGHHLDAVAHLAQAGIAVDEPVEHPHRVAAPQQLVDHDAAHVPGAADDQDLLRLCPHEYPLRRTYQT
jgi:hypothetical protein